MDLYREKSRDGRVSGKSLHLIRKHGRSMTTGKIPNGRAVERCEVSCDQLMSIVLPNMASVILIG